MFRRRPPVTNLTPIRYNAQHPGLQKNLPATFKYDVWGPRKTWVKEVPVPFEGENKTLWGPQRQLVYNKKKKKMEIQIVENSPFVSLRKSAVKFLQVKLLTMSIKKFLARKSCSF